MPLEVEELPAIDPARAARIAPDGAKLAVTVVSSNLSEDRARSVISIYELAAGGPRREATTAGLHPRWAPDSKSLAYLEDTEGEEKGLFVMSAAGGTPRAVCKLRSPGPPAWSDDGCHIALSTSTDAEGSRRIAVVEMAGGATRFLAASPKGSDAFPAWSRDGRIAFARETPGGAEGGPTSELRVAEPGRSRSTVVESGLAYATCPTWRPDGGALACVGTRTRRLGGVDPALRAWILPPGGGEAEAASPDVVGVVLPPLPEGPVWAEDGATVFLRVAVCGEIRLVAIDLEGQAARALVEGVQVADFSSARDGSLAWIELSAADPGGVRLRRDGRATSLADAGGSWARRRGVSLPRPVHRRFEVAPGRCLDGWLLGLDSAQGPQPLLLSFHGGPHGFFGPVFQPSHFYRYVLASRGWIVLCLNSTGSGSYGEAFADRIRGGWGEVDLPEHQAAMAELIGEGIVDEHRLAVAGYSYGGFLAAWAVTRDQRFKAAVIGAPITDLNRFEASSDIGSWYTPWEMKGGRPNSAERYERLSPVARAGAVEAAVLLLHGEADRRVPIEQGELLREHLEAAGSASVEMVRYQGADHLFYAGGRPSRRVDFNRRIVDWLEEKTVERTSLV